ncbi:hypothetical protein [Streptomyces sp. NPDC007991]|uniref:hypothetical protein n=1 Tax=Streptomyces sp. NPDC007991 TaxID=3364803 RepID=UPI0036EFBE3D
MKRKLSVVAATVVVMGAFMTPAAHANTGYENQMSPEACEKSQATSTFKYAIYYNSDFGGAYRNVGYSVWDFADERIGGAPQGGTQPLKFCHGGSGNLQGIKNNAASVKNKHSTYYAVTYFNSGYKGSADWASPRSQSNLSVTKNENASFAWQTL